MPKKKAKSEDQVSIATGDIRDVSGKVTIAGGDIYEGYTVQQVSLLLTQITTNYRRKPFDGRCPYKGLEAFEEEDADLFFGRERLVEDLLSRVKESRTVFITGPSGSGKSSLVRAGLIHALKEEKIKGSDRWLIETMKPGRDPIKELSLAFSRLKGPDLTDYFVAHAHEPDVLHRCAESVLSGQKTQRFLLFVDQFEEVFTQINGEEERQAFINMLAHAGTVENGRVIVLFAMRSDFISNCATYPALNELLSQEFRQIGAMQPEELVAAIALPAKEVGLPIEEELIARIINDMKGEPGALPLMQFALKDLFDAQQEQGGVIELTLADYLKHGGIQKSLERHADASLAALDEEGQTLARSIFSGLIEIGRGTQDTKRTALFNELVPANASPEDVLAIVQKLADARLIITDEQAGKDTVTISHEKLIEAWPWLKKLVNENRDVIALQNEIASDAKEWDDHQRDPSYLYTGARLANVREQLEARKLVLSGTAHEFVVAAQAQQRRSRTTRLIGFAVPIGLVIVGILTISYIFTTNSAILAEERLIAVHTQGALVSTSQAIAVTAQSAAVEAQNQTTIARARELATQSFLKRDNNFLLSLLLGVEAFKTMDIPITRSALLDGTLANSHILHFLSGHNNPILGVYFSPNGKILVSVSADSTIILWNLERFEPIEQPVAPLMSGVSSVAISLDGKTLALGGLDGRIVLWNLQTSKRIGQWLSGHKFEVTSLAFSPDGKILASGGCGGFDAICAGGEIRLWDVETQKPIGDPLVGHKDGVTSLAFSHDGTQLASGGFEFDTDIILWDVKTREPIGEPLTGHSDWIYSIAFSPDGQTLVSGSPDGSIIFWNLQTHQPVGEPLTAQSRYVFGVDFSPDGKLLAASREDGAIILFDVATHQPIENPFTGNSSRVHTLSFSPDGKSLAAGNESGTIILWDIEIHQPIGELFDEYSDWPNSLTFSPDGTMLAFRNESGAIILLNPETRQPIGNPLTGQGGYVGAVTFSPDGKTLASGGSDGSIILWDLETRQPIGNPFTDHGDVVSIAFSPDGRTIASGRVDGKVILWNVETHQPIGQPLLAEIDWAQHVAFSPDSKLLASGSNGGNIFIWNVETRQLVGEPFANHTGSMVSVTFSPDGKTLASGSNNIVTLWNVETHQPIGDPLTGHDGGVNSVGFSHDGKTLASGSDDYTIILWDVETRQPLGSPLIGHTGWVNSVVFDPDGNTLASSSNNEIILWDLDPNSWILKSCQRAGRNFTRAEWTQYFPNEEYRKTCDQWPLEPEITATPTP